LITRREKNETKVLKTIPGGVEKRLWIESLWVRISPGDIIFRNVLKYHVERACINKASEGVNLKLININ
jgi:translation initiation factor IF-1